VRDRLRLRLGADVRGRGFRGLGRALSQRGRHPLQHNAEGASLVQRRRVGQQLGRHLHGLALHLVADQVD